MYMYFIVYVVIVSCCIVVRIMYVSGREVGDRHIERQRRTRTSAALASRASAAVCSSWRPLRRRAAPTSAGATVEKHVFSDFKLQQQR